jgi:hypothetical protein
MSNQGTIRLKVTNDAPAIEKLWNGRFRLEFLCDNNSPKTDWYSENISSILPDYGVLQDTNFGSGVSEDWEAIPGSVYPDMRLVETEYVYIPSMGDKRVKLTYETLTASWVEEKDEDTDYELNGLKRVSRTFVALPATTYDKVVGTSTITSDGTTLTLGGYKIEKTDAKWMLSEVWMESGILSLSIDRTNPEGTQSVSAFNLDDSETRVKLGILLSGYALTESTVSNYEGIETTQFVYKQIRSDEVIDYDLNGLMRLTQISLGQPTPVFGTDIGVSNRTVNGTRIYLAKYRSVDSELKEETYTWIEPGIVDETTRSIDDGLIQIDRLSFRDENAPSVGVVVSKKKQNYNGYPVWATTTIQLKDGTDPTSKVASEYLTFVPFTYPGIADATEELVSSGPLQFSKTFTTTAYDVKLQPPTTADIEATITISYQTSNSVGALGLPLWSPKKWASIESSWSWVRDNSFSLEATNTTSGTTRIGSKYQGLPSYRVGDEASVTYSGQDGANNPLATFFGQTVVPLIGGNWKASGTINIVGGPENPEGKSYIIRQPTVEEAFSDIDGTQYYRKTIVSATIPTQV